MMQEYKKETKYSRMNQMLLPSTTFEQYCAGKWQDLNKYKKEELVKTQVNQNPHSEGS